MEFKHLKIGQLFDWIDRDHPTCNSFYDLCVKISPRTYRSTSTYMVYNVGSIRAKVFPR